MKDKTIRIVLRKKFNEWVESITDKNLHDAVKKETIITGGSIASMLLDEKVNDYDLYFETSETAKKVAEYYVKKYKELHPDAKGISNMTVDENNGRVKIVIKSQGVASEEDDSDYKYFEQDVDPETVEAVEFIEKLAGTFQEEKNTVKPEPYRPIFFSSNAITLSNKIQIVLRFQGKASEIHENFDFIHCTNYWKSGDRYHDKLVIKKDALLSLISKDLKYYGSKYPICSLIRLRKFIKRGWSINAGQILKMAFQISELDLTDVNVLEDQLLGVDFAYFKEVISILKKEVKGGKKIDSTYLASVIDKVF